MDNFFSVILHEIFVLSLSYLDMKSDELFANAKLYKKFGSKSSKKRPGSPVIDMAEFANIAEIFWQKTFGDIIPPVINRKLKY
jgi:hypothetical protein